MVWLNYFPTHDPRPEPERSTPWTIHLTKMEASNWNKPQQGTSNEAWIPNTNLLVHYTLSDNKKIILRVLRIILVVLPEHSDSIGKYTTIKDVNPSRANIQHKLLVVNWTIVLEKPFDVLNNRILYNRLWVLTDPKDQVMVEMEIPRSSGVNSQPHAHT
ncbi:hypothetical protein Tco_0316193 [Tanacetum coccineum]